MSEEGERVELSFYDPEEYLQPGYTVLVLGKRGMGKSHLMLDFCYAMRKKLHVCSLICPTATTHEDFRGHLPESTMYQESKLEILEDIVAKQALLVMRPLQEGKPRVNIGIVVDDMSYDKKAMEVPIITQIMRNGRHQHIFFMFGAQNIIDVPKKQRPQFDVYVFFRVNGKTELETLFKEAGSEAVGDLDTFKQCIRSLQSREALVVDGRARNMGKPYLFVYKARSKEEMGKFRVGCDAFWRLHFKYYRHSVQVANVNEIRDRELRRAYGRPDDPVEKAGCGSGSGAGCEGGEKAEGAGAAGAAGGAGGAGGAGEDGEPEPIAGGEGSGGCVILPMEKGAKRIITVPRTVRAKKSTAIVENVPGKLPKTKKKSRKPSSSRIPTVCAAPLPPFPHMCAK